jgi:5'(3')-deoxyribonucleotidase
MKKLYCDMDGVLVDFVAGAMKLINTALEEPSKHHYKDEFRLLKLRLKKEGRTHICVMDLEKPEYRGVKAEEVMPEARNFMKRLITEAGKNWWATLPWMRGGRTLWRYLAENHDPHILSAPMGDCGSCEIGKLEWINTNLGLDPKKVVLTDEKYVLAKNNVLIDDFEINTVPWKRAGGVAIMHVNAKKTIANLKEVRGNAKF